MFNTGLKRSPNEETMIKETHKIVSTTRSTKLVHQERGHEIKEINFLPKFHKVQVEKFKQNFKTNNRNDRHLIKNHSAFANKNTKIN